MGSYFEGDSSKIPKIYQGLKIASLLQESVFQDLMKI